MGANNLFLGDINKVFGLVQSSMIVYPKEMIIATLKDFFSQDTYYHYVKDEWGFAKTPSHLDLPLGAGVHDNITSRVFIGESFRQDKSFYPAVIIKSSSSKAVPVSINRNYGKIEYQDMLFEDGYGNSKTIKYPMQFVTEGAFEGGISIEISARSIRERDDLVERVAMCFTEIYFDDLVKVGIIVKPPDIGSPSENDDRKDKLFKTVVSLNIRTQWKRVFPIKNIIDTIIFSIEFQDLVNQNSVPAANLTINTDISYTDMILNI